MKKKALIIIATFIAIFFGVGGILPALARVRDVGAMPRPFIASYSLGILLLTVAGTIAVSHFVRSRRV